MTERPQQSGKSSSQGPPWITSTCSKNPDGLNGATDEPDLDWIMGGSLVLSAKSLRRTIEVFQLPASTPWLLQTHSSHFQKYLYDDKEPGNLPGVGKFVLSWPRALGTHSWTKDLQ